MLPNKVPGRATLGVCVPHFRAVESTRAIDIDKFVPEEEIDKRYYESPYYIVPDDKSGDCLE